MRFFMVDASGDEPRKGWIEAGTRTVVSTNDPGGVHQGSQG